jgi:hypothetical protein
MRLLQWREATSKPPTYPQPQLRRASTYVVTGL